jgi:hypothetical protein
MATHELSAKGASSNAAIIFNMLDPDLMRVFGAAWAHPQAQAL